MKKKKEKTLEYFGCAFFFPQTKCTTKDKMAFQKKVQNKKTCVCLNELKKSKLKSWLTFDALSLCEKKL